METDKPRDKGDSKLAGKSYLSPAHSMDLELRFFTDITNAFPNIRGFGRIADIISKLYTRKERGAVISNYNQLKFYVEPSECVDSKVLFYPQLYDISEINYLKDVLSEGDTFIDVGSNIGFYALQASKFVGNSGRVIAIEADPYNYHKLLKNISLNSIDNIVAVNCGVSDKNEQLKLGLNVDGNRGGNSFMRESNEYELVECYPLLKILKDLDVSKITAMKLDIEGFEYRVLREFFTTADESQYPPHILFEDWVEEQKSAVQTPDLLRKYGYAITHIKDENFVAHLSQK